MVAYLQGLAGEAHATLHVVFPAVNGAPLHLAELCRHGLDVVAAHLYGIVVEAVLLQGRHAVQIGRHVHVVHVQFLAHAVVVGILPVVGYCVSGRIVEDNNVVQSHLLGSDALVVPLHALYVTLAQAHGQGVLAQGGVKRSLGHTGAIGHLADKQVITHQQALLQRTGWYGVVLEEIDVDKVDSHQSKHDGIHPRHDGAQDGILQILPPSPVYLLRYIGIEDEGQHDDAPPGLYPHKESDVQATCHKTLCPICLCWFVFLHSYMCVRT